MTQTVMRFMVLLGLLAALPACLLLPPFKLNVGVWLNVRNFPESIDGRAAAALFIFLSLLAFTWPSAMGKQIPGPGRGIPYFQGLFWLRSNLMTLPDACVEMNKLYGGRTWGMRAPAIGLLRGGCVVVTSPESVKHVLHRNFANYVKGEGVQLCMAELLGHGIFATDGPAWTLHRKVASHMFSMRLLKESTRVAARQASKLVRHLKAQLHRGPVDMQSMFFRLTMDIFAEISFGTRRAWSPRRGGVAQRAPCCRRTAVTPTSC